VCALLAGGGYAEYCTVPEGQCMAVPAGVSIRDTAALPEATITVWANLFQPRRVFPGDLFLVQGGSSGIGTTAIQMAKAFGARVATTAGSDEKCSFCLSLGAEVAVNYRTQDWAAELARWSQPHGIDAILDMVAGDYFPKHLDLLATGGRLVHIATSHGSQVTTDLRAVMMKRVLITGSTLRGRSVAEKSSLARGVEKEVWPLFTSGQLRPIIDRAFPLEQAAEAHRWMETGLHTGKIILQMNEAANPDESQTTQ
jgi:NADPH2:quinone reductase